MNVFVDLGAYTGDTIEEFRNWSKVAFPTKTDWIIHAFEPNPNLYPMVKEKSNLTTHTYQKAAWTEDTTLEFAIDTTETPLGSTLMSGKKNIWDNFGHIQVEAFDFSTWLKQFKNDFVVVKMDIEGAEFPVLEKMIQDGTDQICHQLLVEFHPNKVVEFTTSHKNGLIRKLQKRGVNIKEWH